jgi:hypothetical protein
MPSPGFEEFLDGPNRFEGSDSTSFCGNLCFFEGTAAKCIKMHAANPWRCRFSPSVHLDPVSHNTLASFEATLLGTLAILTGWP